MKTAELKAGELYAVRRQYHPCLLLSTNVYREERAVWSSRPTEYHETSAGTKPHGASSYTAPNFGFLTVAGEADLLAGLDVQTTLAAILKDGRNGRPQDTSVELVTSPAAFLGRYAEHQAVLQKRLDAEQARLDRERQRKAAVAHRHNAVVGRLNKALGEDLIARVRDDGYSEPDAVTLTFNAAEAIADLLDTLNPNPEGK